jgi:hypothetical protein
MGAPTRWAARIHARQFIHVRLFPRQPWGWDIGWHESPCSGRVEAEYPTEMSKRVRRMQVGEQGEQQGRQGTGRGGGVHPIPPTVAIQPWQAAAHPWLVWLCFHHPPSTPCPAASPPKPRDIAHISPPPRSTLLSLCSIIHRHHPLFQGNTPHPSPTILSRHGTRRRWPRRS